MFGLFGLGAPAVKKIAPPKIARPDPKVQQAKNQIEAQIRKVEALLNDVPTNTEYRAFLECLRRRLNDISIVCNEPSTPIAKVRQMAREAAAQAKKDATLVKKEEKRAIVLEKQADKKATAAAKVEARKQKKLANGKVISIEPKEETAVAALESQLKQLDGSIADAKKKIAAEKSKRARGLREYVPFGRNRISEYQHLGGLGFLGLSVGGKEFDCSKKKNAQICAIAALTQQTQDQMAGIIQQVVDKQLELETLLAELSALMTSQPLPPTAAEIAAEVAGQLPLPATADEIGASVGTAVTEAIATSLPPTYDPYYGQQPQYPQYDPFGGGYPQQPTQQQPQYYDPESGNLIQGGYSQPTFGTTAQYATGMPTVQGAAAFDFSGGGASFEELSAQVNAGSGTEIEYAGGFSIEDLLTDFPAEGEESGMDGLGCGKDPNCGCKR